MIFGTATSSAKSGPVRVETFGDRMDLSVPFFVRAIILPNAKSLTAAA